MLEEKEQELKMKKKNAFLKNKKQNEKINLSNKNRRK